jgi:hypothetical protein
MFHFTVFGGTEASLPLSNCISFTFFGGTELRRPTLARRLQRLKESRDRPPTFFERVFEVDRNIVVTLFGATEIVAPSLLEEYLDLQNLLKAGVITADEGRKLLLAIAQRGEGRDLYTALTLFGACTVKHPAPDEERRALDGGVGAGLLSERERHELQAVVGRPEAEAIERLARLVFTSGSA